MENRAAGWLQIVANFSLLAGLVLVGFQIAQNNAISRATLFVESQNKRLDYFAHHMGEDPARVIAKASFDPENLTPEEVLILVYWTVWRKQALFLDATLEEWGVFEKGWRGKMIGDGAVIGSTPISREYLIANPDYAAGADWVTQLIDIAEAQPKNGVKSFVERYKEVGKTYATENSE